MIKAARTVVAMAAIVAATASGGAAWAQQQYRVAFSTYMGGSKWEQARDIVTDAEGNIYITGCVTSSEKDGFPVTPGVYAPTFSRSGAESGELGNADGFVAKFSPVGKLLWCTYLGGPNYDRCYSLRLDPRGDIIVCGRAGPGFPTTPDTFQPQWSGVRGEKGLYGAQNGFVAKLSKDGKRLIWATCVGTGHLCRGMDVDDAGDIYVAIGRDNAANLPDPAWYADAFAHAFQKKPGGGKTDLAVVKIKNDGSRVLWATWLCGSGEEREEACVRVNKQHDVFVAMSTVSSDQPLAGDHPLGHHGESDGYYARLSPDGQRLIYGTYIGGKSLENGNETHSLAVDNEGHAWATLINRSPDFPVTKDKGVYDNGRRGKLNIGVIRLSPRGALELATVLGSTGEEKVESMTVDAAGCSIIAGFTTAKDFPTTEGALSRQRGQGEHDAFLVRLSPDFKKLVYSTLISGAGSKFIRGIYVDAAGTIYATGSTSGDWPTVNAFQDHYAGANDTRWCNGDAVLAKFEPVKEK